MRQVTAVVPMRAGSERVPGKNYREFQGRPLFHWILDRLSTCPVVSSIVVDSDCPVVLEEAKRAFPGVVRLRRPPSLGHGETSMNEVIQSVLGRVDGEFFLQTHATNPLLESCTIQAAVEEFFTQWPRHDSLFGVRRLNSRLWDVLGRPVNHNPEVLLRTQDLPPIFEEASCLYLFSRQGFTERFNRIGRRPRLFEVDPIEAWDIDEPHDFKIAECLGGALGGAG